MCCKKLIVEMFIGLGAAVLALVSLKLGGIILDTRWRNGRELNAWGVAMRVSFDVYLMMVGLGAVIVTCAILYEIWKGVLGVIVGPKVVHEKVEEGGKEATVQAEDKGEGTGWVDAKCNEEEGTGDVEGEEDNKGPADEKEVPHEEGAVVDDHAGGGGEDALALEKEMHEKRRKEVLGVVGGSSVRMRRKIPLRRPRSVAFLDVD